MGPVHQLGPVAGDRDASRVCSQSQDLGRRVVQQLGLERLRPALSESHWLPTKFYGSASPEEEKIDHAAEQLLRGLSVSTDPRTYMIEVSYTARDPALAVVITNAFVTEFLRASRLQTLSQQRSLAAATLSQQLAIFGDKHPKAIKAKMRLAAADEQLKQPAQRVARRDPQECRRERHRGDSGACKTEDAAPDRTAAAGWPHARCRNRALARAGEVGGHVSSLLQQTLRLRIGDRRFGSGRRLPGEARARIKRVATRPIKTIAAQSRASRSIAMGVRPPQTD